MTALKVGDHVTLGPDNGKKIAWQISAIHQADATHTYATVCSGNYGITKVVPLERLHPWANRKEKK